MRRLEGEAVAAQAPDCLANALSGLISVGGVDVAGVRLRSSHALQRIVVATVVERRSPIERDRKGRRSMVVKVFACVYHFSSNHGESGLEMLDLFLGDVEVVGRQDREVCKLPYKETALGPIFG